MRCGGVGFERQPGRAVGESHYNPGGAAEKLPRLAGGIGLVAKCLVLRAKHWEKVCWSYWMGTVLVNGRALGEATGYLDLLRCGGWVLEQQPGRATEDCLEWPENIMSDVGQFPAAR